MPNWCSNSVVFSAVEDTLEKIRELFAQIEQKQQQDEKYHLPSFVTKEEGYMQDIIIDKNRINFETRWVPNIETLIEIADFYQAGFTCKYDEMANGIFGEARYDQSALIMANLDMEDFKAIRYDKQQKGYPCGQQVFEYEGDLLDYLLEQKMLNNNVIELTVRQM
jgi:hypothetical protein